MKKYIKSMCVLMVACVLFSCTIPQKQEKKPTSVILIVADGMSNSLYNLIRYKRMYVGAPYPVALVMDTLMKGVVITHCSNSPGPDSPPTISTYHTGMPQIAGSLSIYPPKTKQDIVPVDSAKAYYPLLTLLEAAQLRGFATGLVSNTPFCHATMAGTCTHWMNRNDYPILYKQMLHSKADVIIAGGAGIIKQFDGEQEISAQGYGVYLDDPKGMLQNSFSKLWACYGQEFMPYELDRNKKLQPSLKEMSMTAILHLLKLGRPFFLQIEAGMIDQAAHINDIPALIAEVEMYIATLEAVIDFASKRDDIAVVVVADHATGGVTIGSECSDHSYAHLSLADIFAPFDNVKLSAQMLADSISLLKEDRASIKNIWKKYYHSELNDTDLNYILQNESLELPRKLTKVFNRDKNIGFTTHGHDVGEAVLWGANSQSNNAPEGIITNVQFHQYMAELLGVKKYLTDNTYYIPHSNIFFDADTLWIDSISKTDVRLHCIKNNHHLEVESYSSTFSIDSLKYDLGTKSVYIPQNKTFYISAEIRKYM